MKFNEKLLKLRKEKGLSQEELGMEMQVSRQTVSKWETGQSYPDFTRLVMLSDFFNMTLDELVISASPGSAPGYSHGHTRISLPP